MSYLGMEHGSNLHIDTVRYIETSNSLYPAEDVFKHFGAGKEMRYSV